MRVPVLLPALLLSGVASLAGSSVPAQDPGRAQLPPVRVFAAASLIEALPGISEAWQSSGGAPLEITYDGSSRLATQIEYGAPADVFLSADRAWTDWLVQEGRVDAAGTRVFASNGLVVLARMGSDLEPASLGDVRDLVESGRSLALAGENVPAGRYAEAALRNAGLWEAVRSRVIRGGSTLSVVEWVRRGEVDLGMAYQTDARRTVGVDVVLPVDPSSHPAIEYVAATITSRENRGGDRAETEAARFVAFLGGPEAQNVLRSLGFEPPGAGPAPITGRPPPQSGAAPSNPVGSMGSPATAVRLSLLVALLATALGAVPAVGLGWLLARGEFRGKALVSTAVLAPLVLPPVVTGYLLLWFLGREGWGGRALGAIGIQIPFTLLGAVLAAAVVGLPLFVLAARAAFEGVDRRYEDVATSLGWPPLQTFLRVALPLARPGILAGAVLAFARSLGEFGATIVLAGNLEGATRTIPLAVYTLLESPGQGGAIWVLVGASVLLSLGALILYETLSGAQRSRAH